MKRTLKNVLGNARLKFGELETVLVETESTEEALTPNHFIFGYRLGTLPDSETDSEEEETDEGKCISKVHTNKTITSEESLRWEREYLTDLREYHEMRSKENDKPEIGEVVMIKKELTNRGKWKLGSIILLTEEPP